MKRRHRGVLITKLVLRPDAAFAFSAVDCVNEPKTARFIANRTRDIRIGKEAWRHARPECEDNKSNQIANCHCASSCSVQFWTSRGDSGLSVSVPVVHREVHSVPCGGIPEKPNQVENCSRNVDKRINPVGPMHEERVLEKPALNVQFEEDVELLF